MTAFPDGLLADALHRMTGADLICYCPCAGRDVAFALTVLGSYFGRFVFCDSGYQRKDMTGRGVVPANWRIVHSACPQPPSRQPDRSTPHEVIETWSRPDGTEVTLEFLKEPAEECLSSRFAAGTLSALLHINDGAGEGGSDLWFLGSSDGSRAEASRCFLPMVAELLTDEALVITDGMLADPEFARGKPFRRFNRYWEPLAPLENTQVRDRCVTVWRTIRERGL